MNNINNKANSILGLCVLIFITSLAICCASVAGGSFAGMIYLIRLALGLM